MNGIDEGRKNIEKINFVMQGMAEFLEPSPHFL